MSLVFENFKKVELPDTKLTFVGMGRDTNGNKLIKLMGMNGKKFSIQTNGNLPTAQRLIKGEQPTDKQLQELSKEVTGYIRDVGTARQKAMLEGITDYSLDLDDGVVMIDEQAFNITQGMAKAFGKGSGLVVKKVCPKCGFHMPKFSGRYPKNCPLCDTQFEKDITEKIAVYEKDTCVAIYEKCGKKKKVIEGSDIEGELYHMVNDIVKKVKDGEIKTKKDLNKTLGLMKSTKNIKNNFAEFIKLVAKRMKEENVKL